MEIVKKEASNISYTTDAWTSLNDDSYLGVTAHFINPEFKLCHIVCDISHFPGSHTAEAMAEKLQSVISDWNGEKTNFTVTSDNASNMIQTSDN